MEPLTAGTAAMVLNLALGPGTVASRAAFGPDVFQRVPGVERTIDQVLPEVRFGFTCPLLDWEWAGPCKWRVRLRSDTPTGSDPTVPARPGRMTDTFAAAPGP
jgi:hypothetical protein